MLEMVEGDQRHGGPAREWCDEIMDWCSSTAVTPSATFTWPIYLWDTV